MGAAASPPSPSALGRAMPVVYAFPMADKPKRSGGLVRSMGIAAFVVVGVFLAFGVDISIGAGLLMLGFGRRERRRQVMTCAS